MPAHCPECQSALHRDEEEVVWRCENTVVPGAASPQPRALRVALRDEHRRPRRVAGRSADRAGPRARLRRPVSPDRRAARRRWSSPRRSRDRSARCRASSARSARNVVEQLERSKSNDLSRLIYALGIRHVGEKAAATLARHFRTMERIMTRAARGAAVGVGDRAGRGRVGAGVRGRAAQPRARRPAERGRRQHGEPGAGAERRARSAVRARPSCSPARWRRCRARRRPRRSSGSAPRCPARSARRPATSSSGATPAANSRRRDSSGVETLDEEKFLTLIMKR